MDFDITVEQQARLTAIDEVVEACGGSDRGFEISRAAGHDSELDDKLGATGLLAGASLLDRVLIAEELARQGLATTFGLRAVLTADGIDGVPDGPIAVVDRSRTGPVRFGQVAETLVVLDGDEAQVLEAADCGPRVVRSSFGYPYAELHDLGSGRDLPAGSGALLRRRWRLALAAEISGNAATGVARTAAHLTERVQFGRPLATFQALRHRLAEAAVSAEATRWMAREAAWFSDDDRRGTLAAWYAGQTGASLATELSQMCGARSFTLEFGLHVFVMRLDGLRLELGGPDRLSTELASTGTR